MAWRNHPDHKSETKAVKAALRSHGFAGAKVSHGTGTAWAWLHVEIKANGDAHSVVMQDDTVSTMTREEKRGLSFYAPCVGNCPACTIERDKLDSARKLVRKVTGRHGDHGGEMIIQFSD